MSLHVLSCFVLSCSFFSIAQVVISKTYKKKKVKNPYLRARRALTLFLKPCSVENQKGSITVQSSAVVHVCRLFRKPVNLHVLQKTVGYRLTFSQSSNLYFLSIHAILLELDHQCVHMYVMFML